MSLLITSQVKKAGQVNCQTHHVEKTKDAVRNDFKVPLVKLARTSVLSFARDRVQGHGFEPLSGRIFQPYILQSCDNDDDFMCLFCACWKSFVMWQIALIGHYCTFTSEI